MIRVNLLATSPGASPKRDWFPKEQRGALTGLALLVVTALIMGAWWAKARADRIAVDNQIASDEAEILRLKDVAKLVETASARKAELTERLGLIDRLRSTQRDPVTLLETVSASVPDGLWLTELKQAGPTVQIEGRATSLTSVEDFTERMQNSGVFERPVEIVSAIAETVEETPVVRFIVKGQTVDKGKSGAATAAAKPASSAPAPPTAGGQ